MTGVDKIVLFYTLKNMLTNEYIKRDLFQTTYLSKLYVFQSCNLLNHVLKNCAARHALEPLLAKDRPKPSSELRIKTKESIQYSISAQLRFQLNASL